MSGMERGPIRILHVLGVLNMGGAESRIMDLYRNMDRSQVQFDFLVHCGAAAGSSSPSSEQLMAVRAPEHFDEEIRALGGQIYALPRFTGTNFAAYKKAVRAFFAAHHEWTAVEGHMTSTASVYLPIAASYGMRTIAHLRSAGDGAGLKGRVTHLLRSRLRDRAQILFSCSRDAALAIYGEKAVRSGLVTVIPNAVDTGAFAFDPAVRARMRARLREEMGIPEDAFVAGHVGRFDAMKNQAFLVRVLKEAGDAGNGAKKIYAVFVGQGADMAAVQRAAEEAGMAEYVRFAGQRDREETAAFYQAFDAFLFPSLYEGVPGTVVEAQAAGLPCLISDRVTDEVCISGLVRRMPLDEAAWAKETAALADRADEDRAARQQASADAMAALAAEGYDAAALASRMQEYYLDLTKPALLLVVPMLHQGGFERVCVSTARLLAPYCRVSIAIFDDADIAYDIRGLEVIDLDLPAKAGLSGKLLNVPRRVRALKKLKKRLCTKVTYSLGQTANLAGALAGCGDRVVLGIRSFQDLDNPEKIRLFVRKADLLVCCSAGIEEKIRAEYGALRTCTVYNPVRVPGEDELKAGAEAMPEHIRAFLAKHPCRVMSMGREDDVKGFWHLLRAFAAAQRDPVLAEGPRAGLVIIGEGDFTEYRELAASLGIADDVLFPGVLNPPFTLLAQADVYALTSSKEGFPNALVEAMAVGVPVISTDCPTGPREILAPESAGGAAEGAAPGGAEDAPFGILVPVMDEKKDLDPRGTSPGEDVLASQIIRLLSERGGDPAAWAARRGRGKARAADFTEEAYIRAFLDAFALSADGSGREI